jgi:hypothetical protein
MFVLMFSPCFLFGQDVVVVLLKTEGCAPCVELEKVISNPTVQSTIAQNKVLFRAYYGEKWPKYLARHRITSFPTMLKFERNSRGVWVEQERVVGVKKLNFLLDFLGKRSIIKRVKEIPRKVILGGS